MKKLLFAFLIALLPLSASAQAVSGGVNNNLWKLSGGNLLPAISTWGVGSPAVPIINGYFTNLFASTTSFTHAGGDLDMGGYQILNAGKITGTHFSATSTTATTTLSGGLTVDTNTLVVDYSTNNVGIGTASPTAPLQISNSGVSTTLGQLSNNLRFENVENTTVDGGNEISFKGIGANLNTSIYAAISAPLSSAAADGIFGYLSFSTKALRTDTALTERMRITNSGTVGIASSTPWGLLSVNPNALGSGVPEFVVGSSTATHFVVDGSGAVGIGTASPGVTVVGSRLDIQANGNSAQRLYLRNTNAGSSAYGAINFGNDSSTNIGGFFSNSSTNTTFGGTNSINLVTVGTGSLSLGTNSASNLTILNGGNVGIGTGAPTTPTGLTGTGLHMHSASLPWIKLTTTATGQAAGDGFYVTQNDDTTEFWSFEGGPLSFGVANAAAFQIYSTGVNIGANATPGAQFKVTSQSSSRIASIIKGAASQSADLTQWQDSTGAVLNVVTSSGNLGIGTTTPFASLSLSGNATTIPFAISSTTATSASTTLFMIDKGAWVHYGGGTPVVSSCGTAPTLDANSTDQSGSVTFGASASGCTVTFAQPAPSKPHCIVSTEAVSLVNAYTVTESTTALTITQAASGGVTFDYFCPLGH